MTYRVKVWLGTTAALAACFVHRPAAAVAGSHAAAVSSYDTRASSIVFAYRHGFSDTSSFNTFSYNANFTSTTGRLSAQFGIHYVNFKEQEAEARAHGVAGGGVAVLVFPVAGRYDNGVPKVGLALHLGGVPTAYIGGERNSITLPFVLGFGVPLSPAPWLTITPWYEAALSVNLDTVIKPEGVVIDESYVDLDPSTRQVTLRPDAVDRALAQGVQLDLGVAVPMRAGLETAFHLGKAADLNLYGMLSTLGGAFSGELVKTLGGSLLIRWDDVVPAVLPKPAVETHESCEVTEQRFRACPNSRQWLSPEQRGQPAPAPPPASDAPPSPAEPPPPAAPVPAAPAPEPSAPPSPSPAPTPADPAPASPPSGSTSFPEP